MQAKKVICSVVFVCAAFVVAGSAKAQAKAYNFGVAQPNASAPDTGYWSLGGSPTAEAEPAPAPISAPASSSAIKPNVEVFPLDDNTVMSSTVPTAPMTKPLHYTMAPAPVSAPLPPPPELGLETRTGLDVAAQATEYRYRESSTSERLNGIRYGGQAAGTYSFGDRYFVSAGGRYATGLLDYTGTGTFDNRRNFEWEARGLFGKDFVFDEFSLSPYTGFGYRFISDNLSGVTSAGTHLTRRDDELYYLPLGIQPRFQLDSRSRLSTLLEYDFLFHGAQTAHLGDAHAGDPNVTNQQRVGEGARAEVMYETLMGWSFGPFVNYWNINSSARSTFFSPNSSCGSTTCTLVQPHNHSLEAGLQFRVHFF